MSYLVLNGNNVDVLKQYPDNYFDAVVTDPPYGLGKEPDAQELMKDWVEKGYHEIQGSGFMGKEWDAFVPQPIFWKEVFRVLKHGGHIVAFYGTRTYDWGVMAMRFAGFEVRDCIQWVYGSGFPKSHNIGKNIEKIKVGGIKNLKQIGTKKGVTSESGVKGFSLTKEFVSGKYIGGKQVNGDVPIYEINNEYAGWGSALKPANEPIVLARKPLEKGLSIAENVLKWGTGGINIDGCRVSGVNMTKGGCKFNSAFFKSGESNFTQDYDSSQGRFPANIILTHHPECECKGLKKVKGSSCKPEDVGKGKNESYNNGIYSDKKGIITISHNDENGEETIEDWDCHHDCPIKIMDEQSGILKSTGAVRKKNTDTSPTSIDYKHPKGELSNPYAGEIGGASRFFYCAKASKSERNKGLEGFEDKLKMTQMRSANGSGEKNFEGGFQDQIMKNIHPTVKPVKLMQYLVRLITPPNGKVLDPFCGSGTTGIACKLEGVEFVGIEQDAEYCKIAEARITNFTEEPEEVSKSNTDEVSQNEDENPRFGGQMELFS